MIFVISFSLHSEAFFVCQKSAASSKLPHKTDALAHVAIIFVMSPLTRSFPCPKRKICKDL